MFKKIFWGVIGLSLVFLVFLNSHRVPFKYPFGEATDFKLDFIIVIAFAAGVLCVYLSGFISKSQDFFSGMLSYSTTKKKKQLDENFKEAVNCIELKNYKRAKELLDPYLKEEVGNIDAYLYLADIYLSESQTDNAEEVLKKASVVSKYDVKILSKLADVYIKSKKFDKAIKTYEDIKAKEENKAFYSKKIYDIYLILKDYKKAYKIQKELEKDKSYADFKGEFLTTKYNLALTLIKSKKFEEAEKILKSIVSDDRRFYGAYISLANTLYEKGEHDQAIEFLMESYDKTKFPFFAKLIERYSLKKEDPQQALLFYQKQIDKIEIGLSHTKGPQAWMDSQALILYALYINLLLKLEMIDYAIEAINYIVGTEDDKKIFHFFLAECYFRHNKFKDASEQYHTYLKGHSKQPIMLLCNECGAEYDDFQACCDACGTYNKINYYVN
jgi:predicted Zn-dependent protease